VWIGELQWRIQRGYGFKLNPVLEPLDHIECRDAVLTPDGKEAAWPRADVVVGNPPFLGTKKQWGELGVAYSERLRAAYAGRVPGFADLVCYWFEKARSQIEAGALIRAGLVSTNSIRGGANRDVLDRVVATTRIFNAYGDVEWVNDGAAVRVSLIAFGESTQDSMLDGVKVPTIHADLTSGANLTEANKLIQNRSAAFVATVKAGAFDIAGATAREWLKLPNPNARPNADVVKPWANGMDMTRRWSDTWIIDFGVSRTEAEAALYETPFAHVRTNVKPLRDGNKRASYRDNWWLLAEPIPKMRAALRPLARYIGTPVVAKFRLFVWMHECVLADHQLVVTAREDDATFGILHSRFHELWSLRLGTSLEDRPRYTPTTCFETFPFPAGLTPADTSHQRTETIDGGAVIPAGLPVPLQVRAGAIAQAAQRLVYVRNNWLNPPEWTTRIPELVPLGMETTPYPDRIVARAGFEAELTKRTLTNLYNLRPAWLAQAHAALDAAVAAAYGWADWTADMPDEEILRRLLALNRQRSAEGG
jgi:type II restriction/modification system DNA methylase subunit YeeA